MAQTLDDLLRFLSNPAPGSQSLTAAADEIPFNPGFGNTVPFNMTGGQTPKFQMPLASQLVYVDKAGNLGAGLNYLLDSPLPGNLHFELPDFIVLQNSLRFGARNLTLGEINDPCDITLRRCGPVAGYPYAGGLGTATLTRGNVNVPVTGTDANAIALFKTNRRVVCSGVPDGATITGITPVDANNVTLTLSTPPNTTGTATLYSIGTTQDLCGLGAGAQIGQFKGGPFIVPYLGDTTTPGASFQISTFVSTGVTSEMARDLTGNGDYALGTQWQYYTTRNGRGNPDQAFELSQDGCTLVGLGAIQAGSTGDLLQVRGFLGQDDKQTVTLTGTPTGGTFTLRIYQDPTTLGTTGYPNSQPSAPIPYNAPLDNNDGGVGANDVRFFIADLLRQVLATTPPSPTMAQAYTELKITSAGTTANAAPFTVDFGGNATTTAFLTNRHFIRMGPDGSGLLNGSATVSHDQTGIPSSSAQRLLMLKRTVAAVVDNLTIIDQNGNAQLRHTADNSLVVGQGGLATTATGGFLYVPTCAGTPTGTPTAYANTVPLVFDTTANKLWIYRSGWKAAAFV